MSHQTLQTCCLTVAVLVGTTSLAHAQRDFYDAEPINYSTA